MYILFVNSFQEKQSYEQITSFLRITHVCVGPGETYKKDTSVKIKKKEGRRRGKDKHRESVLCCWMLGDQFLCFFLFIFLYRGV